MDLTLLSLSIKIFEFEFLSAIFRGCVKLASNRFVNE